MKKMTTCCPSSCPSRQATLAKACAAATFEAGPPPVAAPGTRVGSATATTPALPGTLAGTAYLVSHGGEAFPDLDLVLQRRRRHGDPRRPHQRRQHVITTTFESLPDVPVSSFTLKLPTGSNSVLAANGNLCTANLVMPTTIVAQSGRDDHAEDEDLGHQLPGADPQTPDLRHDCDA